MIFTLGKAENVIIQYHDVTNSAGQGSIFIQNQGGGLRSCQQIKVESKTGFSDDTALNVFTVTLDSSILDVIQSLDPDIYEKMMDGVTYTYNISLLKDGAETQPNGMVTVYIPIPEDLKVLAYASMVAGNVTGKVSIYRMEEDGSLTEMDVRIEDGCFVFTTDHFSLYTIVGPDYGAKFNSNVWMIILFVAGFGCILPAILLFKKKKYVPTAILIVVGIVLLTIGAGSRLLADPQRGEDTVDETTVQTLPAEVDEQPTEAQTESPTEAPTQAEAELTPLEYWIEYCDTRNLTQEDLETFDAATCRLARNAIFAKSGRQFADASLQTFYEQFDWYDPTVPPDDFTDDMLNQYQVYN